MARKRKKLGEILREWGTIGDTQVEQALGIAKGTGKRFGEALVEAGLCSEEDVSKALAAQFDMEYIDLDAPEAANSIDTSLVPEDLAKKHLILPLGRSGGRLKLVDALARGLLGAASLIEEGRLQRFVDRRYAGWETELGRGILSGERDLADLSSQVLGKSIDPQPRSGRQELLENWVSRALS